MASLSRSTLLLLVLSTPALAAPDWSRARQLTVVMTEYEFSPAKVTFARGVPYRLHLENRGGELHEFHSAAFFKNAELRDPGVLNAEKDEVVVQPGTARDVYLVAKRPGHYRLFCPDHDWAGMTGEIIVR